MESFSPSVSRSSFPVIPPITSDRDDMFLSHLNDWITHELTKVDLEDPHQRYHVYKEAFDRILAYLTVYRPILTRFKAEYEGCIETICKGQREAFFLAGKLNEVAHAPTTLQNYWKRTEDLWNKISIIQRDNHRLCKNLDELKSRKSAAETDKDGRQSESLKKEAESVGMVQHGKRPVQGLTVEQATDCNILQAELEKVEQTYKELRQSYNTRYSSRALHNQLKEDVAASVLMAEQLNHEVEHLNRKRHKLTLAMDAAKAYLQMQPPDETIGQVIVKALVKDAQTHNLDAVDSAGCSTIVCNEVDDQPNDNETELILDYLEKFNELLESQSYEQAAIHAANSIKGVLRTAETMQRFKDLSLRSKCKPSMLLTFCDALASTVPSFGVPLTELMSEECVDCALKENRLDLLSHWLTKDRLTVTEKMGNMIYRYCTRREEQRSGGGGSMVTNHLALAQKVYVDVASHVPALVCMVKQGRIRLALDYAERNRCLAKDLIQVLSQCPDLQFADALFKSASTDQSGKAWLPLGVIVTILLDAGHQEHGIAFLKDVYVHGLQEQPSDDSLKKAVSDDHLTTFDQWMAIVQKCQQDADCADCARDLSAAVAVTFAARNASKNLEKPNKEQRSN